VKKSTFFHAGITFFSLFFTLASKKKIDLPDSAVPRRNNVVAVDEWSPAERLVAPAAADDGRNPRVLVYLSGGAANDLGATVDPTAGCNSAPES
jgi:hypothetical protein